MSFTSSLSDIKKEATHFSTVELTSESIQSCSSSDIEQAEQTVDDVPNGGLVAWLQVLGAFFLWFNTW
ncbi:unnamed protein product [Aureobasidium uvarum]|uniref:Uncharacterized protein n=1 Tax=Aureobasidium uvarum TaxID=2773716 RepID=A0A9N8PR38_9PEZI|nr:unnamed protein product [Aureobasidium uvarum]